MPFMYIMECSDGTYYTGTTDDLFSKIQKYKSGKGPNYVRKRMPARMVYFEEFHSARKADQRKKQVKKWGHERKKALIEGTDIIREKSLKEKP